MRPLYENRAKCESRVRMSKVLKALIVVSCPIS